MRGFSVAFRSLVCLATVAILLPASPVSSQPEGAAPSFEFYGFFRLDAVYDDSRVQNHQYAFWALSEDSRVGPKDDSHLTVYPRVTRIGIRFAPKPVSERLDARGVLELDFQAGGSESREQLRMRLAYFELIRDDFRFRGGQDWDVISPLYPGVHTDGVLWNAGNLGDRHPQARVMFDPNIGDGTFHAALATGLTGAVDGQDLDRNGLLDGQDASIPFVQSRVGMDYPFWNGAAARLGVWGHYGEEDIADGTCQCWAAGFDASVPLLSRLFLEGEMWLGSDVSDLRGGIGQGVNPVTMNEVDAQGGWAQLAINPVDRWWAYVGASADDPDDEDLLSVDDVEAAGLSLDSVGRTLNYTAFFSNRYKPWESFQIGLEYVYWVTEYKGLDRGIDNRFNLHFSYIY